jgi:hypothetical protein
MTNREPEGESVSLWGACGEFSMPGDFWVALLNVSQLYGWIPAGTKPPDPSVLDAAQDIPTLSSMLGGRDGGYHPSCCQVMTQDDAQRFALGLERALLDIPEAAQFTSQESLDPDIEPFTGWNERWSGLPVSIMERFATAKGILRDLIIHCRECGKLWIC